MKRDRVTLVHKPPWAIYKTLKISRKCINIIILSLVHQKQHDGSYITARPL